MPLGTVGGYDPRGGLGQVYIDTSGPNGYGIGTGGMATDRFGANVRDPGYRPPGEFNPYTMTFNPSGLSPSAMSGGGGAGGFSFGGSGMGGGGIDINGLINRQMQNNERAYNNNQNNWFMARDRLLGVGSRYDNDATANATRGLTNRWLADPEALNDRTQQMIRNKASNQISAMADNQLRQQAGTLAANGQLDAGSIRALQAKIGRGAMAQQQSATTNLEIQRANQRNQDFANAASAGRAMSAQDYGVHQGIANTLIQNLPQYKPDDYSGLIAIAGQQQLGQQMNAMMGNQMSPTFGGGALNFGQSGFDPNKQDYNAGFSFNGGGFNAQPNQSSYQMPSNGWQPQVMGNPSYPGGQRGTFVI